MGDYVLLAGCYTWYGNTDIDSLATITFSCLNDEDNIGNVEIIAYATKYDDSLDNLKAHAKKDPVLRGDMNESKEIELDDALMMLKAALNIEQVDENQIQISGSGWR